MRLATTTYHMVAKPRQRVPTIFRCHFPFLTERNRIKLAVKVQLSRKTKQYKAARGKNAVALGEKSPPKLAHWLSQTP